VAQNVNIAMVRVESRAVPGDRPSSFQQKDSHMTEDIPGPAWIPAFLEALTATGVVTRAMQAAGAGEGGASVAYLSQTMPVPEDVAALTAPVPPNAVLRTAAPCAGSGCRHFSGHNCTLIERIAAALDPVVDRPPACAIRGTCRWWAEQGRAACVRCPQIVTDRDAPSEAYALAMMPPERVGA
jgi:hypothetical protein